MINEKGFYTPDKILSMKDINGRDPAYRLIVGVRTAGKSFGCKRLILRRYIRRGERFMVLKHRVKQMPGFAENMTTDLFPLYPEFSGHTLEQVGKRDDISHTLLFDGEKCGCVSSIMRATDIKDNSAAYSDIDRILFDEVFTMDNKYVDDFMGKLKTIVVSVARGGGKHVRPLEVIMIGNTYSLLNPIFVKFGIHRRLHPETKFLRGNGWVLEQVFNESATRALEESAILAPFIDDEDIAGATRNVFYLDNDNFIERLDGEKYPAFAIVMDGVKYGVWYCGSYLYVSTSTHGAMKTAYGVNTDSHKPGTLLISFNPARKRSLINAFEGGLCRFESALCRAAFFELIGRFALK